MMCFMIMWFDSLVAEQRHALRKLVTAPMVVAAMPPISSHMDLSVGVPVKKRLASDPNDSEALIPKTISAIPTANRASPIPLFTTVSFDFVPSRKASPAG
jgi:hypothetical protein